MTRSFPSLRVALAVAVLCAGCRSGAGGSSSSAPRGPGDPVGEVAGSGVTWHWEAPSPASVGMPAADEHEVAFTYGHQHLVVLDASGRSRWDVARLGLRDVAPRFTADLVVAATDDGMAAFRRTDGTKVWDTPLQARANTPVVAGNLAVTSTWEGDLVGVDLVAGKVAWRTALGGAAMGPPATDGTTVVATWEEIHGQAGGAVGVDAATGRRRWATTLLPRGISAPVVLPRGTVVAVAGDMAAHGLALAGGQELWRTALDGAGSPEVPPAAVGTDMVLTAHRLGGLDLLDAATGRRSWQVRTDGIAVRGGPVAGPVGTFAFPLDDGRMVMAGPTRGTEFRQAPNRISGLAVGPGGLLLAATRGATVNSIQATPAW
jgi:outer membrane protein assembly factor BamB